MPRPNPPAPISESTLAILKEAERKKRLSLRTNPYARLLGWLLTLLFPAAAILTSFVGGEAGFLGLLLLIFVMPGVLILRGSVPALRVIFSLLLFYLILRGVYLAPTVIEGTPITVNDRWINWQALQYWQFAVLPFVFLLGCLILAILAHRKSDLAIWTRSSGLIFGIPAVIALTIFCMEWQKDASVRRNYQRELDLVRAFVKSEQVLLKSSKEREELRRELEANPMIREVIARRSAITPSYIVGTWNAPRVAGKRYHFYSEWIPVSDGKYREISFDAVIGSEN